MKKTIAFLCLLLSVTSHSQEIHTTDLDNYWIAYDSIKSTDDFQKQLGYINRLYINKRTKGLKQFMWARNYSDTLYLKMIEAYPKFWESLRPNIHLVEEKTDEIKAAFARFKELYPQLKPTEIYFTIGSFRSGGTTKDNMVLIGTEIAAGMPNVDASEFPTNRLANVFSKQTPEHIVSLAVHENVHTQQKDGTHRNVLAFALNEGSCDFITELVIGRPLVTSYLTYGREHAAEIKERFKKELFAPSPDRWVYNTVTFGEAGDMGYYIGYEICKAYYNKAKDKKKAIRDIIRLNYRNPRALERFLEESGFYSEPLNKKQIIEEYRENQPYVVSMEPFGNGAIDVDSGIQEFKITFSKPMDPQNISIYYTKKGKKYFPFEKVLRMENDNKTFVFKTDMYAGREYEFLVSDEEFSTVDGFKMRDKSFKVKFKTKDFPWPDDKKN